MSRDSLDPELMIRRQALVREIASSMVGVGPRMDAVEAGDVLEGVLGAPM